MVTTAKDCYLPDVTISSFEYEDKQRGWQLARTTFTDFNLLVGLSGVGKTSIIKALRNVRAVGLSKSDSGRNSRWRIELASENQTYVWSAEIIVREGASLQGDDEDKASRISFQREDVVTGSGQVLVDRSPERFLFEGGKLPKLKDTESAISLLKAEDSIAPLYRALQRMLFSDVEHSSGALFVEREFLEETESATALTLDSLRERIEIPVLLKAYLAQQQHSEAFERIRQQYMEIFPNVSNVCVGRVLDLDPNEARRERDLRSLLNEFITLAIKEGEMDQWIIAPYMSSGMLRTFTHLAELELAPRGTVIAIDEYENSMGINCLPAVTAHFLTRQPDLQFILTSHHPYVINNIPIERWRLVTRKGQMVQVRSAEDVAELSTASKQDAFTLLTNSSVFEEGIQ